MYFISRILYDIFLQYGEKNKIHKLKNERNTGQVVSQENYTYNAYNFLDFYTHSVYNIIVRRDMA